jgi:hypothetical protein
VFPSRCGRWRGGGGDITDGLTWGDDDDHMDEDEFEEAEMWGAIGRSCWCLYSWLFVSILFGGEEVRCAMSVSST